MGDGKFEGFPAEAVRFYDELEANNAKPWWEAHKATYEAACRVPMQALLDELEPEFGASKMMRPYRDIRFSADKSPYKTNCAAVIGTGGYLALSSSGLYVGGGCMPLEGAPLARFREAAASEAAGQALASILAKLGKAGYEVEGEQLKTVPRGYRGDHPRAELLRYKGLHAGKPIPASNIQSRAVTTTVRKMLRDLMPLAQWLDDHVGAREGVGAR